MLLDIVKEGDTIITLEVSRLSRSTQQLCEIIDIIREKKLRLIILGSISQSWSLTVQNGSGMLPELYFSYINISINYVSHNQQASLVIFPLAIASATALTATTFSFTKSCV